MLFRICLIPITYLPASGDGKHPQPPGLIRRSLAWGRSIVVRCDRCVAPASLALALLVAGPRPEKAVAADLTAAPGLQPAQRPLALQEPAGLQRLLESDAHADYGPLAQTFLTQTTLSFCGVASAAMVLNSLPITAPAAANLGPYPYWTQENLLPAAGERSGLSAALVASRGLSLAELERLLVLLGADVRRWHGDQLSLPALRALLRRSLAEPADRLIVNVDRAALGQAGGGHHSPLAAYHRSSDSVLMLDVARYRYPAAWVPVPALWRAMRSPDQQTQRARGLLMIKPAARQGSV